MKSAVPEVQTKRVYQQTIYPQTNDASVKLPQRLQVSFPLKVGVEITDTSPGMLFSNGLRMRHPNNRYSSRTRRSEVV